MMKKLELKCYICGDPIEQLFALASEAAVTDRPLVVHERCSLRVHKNCSVIAVCVKRSAPAVVQRLRDLAQRVDQLCDNCIKTDGHELDYLETEEVADSLRTYASMLE